jgi:hypothetical protein
MGDPQSWWLNLTNFLLGGGVLAFVLAVVAGMIYDKLKHHA